MLAKQKNRINQLDDSAEAKASLLRTQESYNAYLNEFPRGKYTIIIREKLALKKEDDYFKNAKQENKLYGLENYLNIYPNGRYVEEANNLIEEILIKRINSLNDNKDYRELQNVISKYNQKFPNSKKYKELNKLNKKAERNLNKRNSGMLLLSYETNESFGFQIGSLRQKNLGWYLSVRATANILDATFQRDEVITKTDLESTTIEYETVYGSASLGLTYPIAYPLYLSAGAGVNFKQYLHETPTGLPNKFGSIS